ncbi:hypothetical protein [Anaeromicrobium sediminis]|uniref:Uncharacterized protein n=1 Tax=Anaeromicrobium sediminis TaxID=1478221 RepID=A0A267MQ16_9FIRM|nr:hypothetical protein [Anaeromicrobium sediminis]PAB60988.1 hypothetical protein CCE28_00720 [Anaeromicrobium sediminis]
MEPNVKRGKIILISIICASLLLDATMTALVTFKFGLHRLPHGIIRFLVTSTFMYYIYTGKRWVKNLFAGLLIYSVISILLSYNTSLLLHPLMLLLLIVHSVSATLLIFSKDVRSYLDEKATRV